MRDAKNFIMTTMTASIIPAISSRHTNLNAITKTTNAILAKNMQAIIITIISSQTNISKNILSRPRYVEHCLSSFFFELSVFHSY